MEIYMLWGCSEYGLASQRTVFAMISVVALCVAGVRPKHARLMSYILPDHI